jgi:hypothetical protein
MKEKVFDNGMVVKHRKSAIILENHNGKKEKEGRFTYEFTKEDFKEFTSYMEKAASEAWSNITPKEATSLGSDYYEYYDRKYDDNGYLHIGENSISVDAPYWSIDTLYQFNKPKIQSFLYDLQKNIKK